MLDEILETPVVLERLLRDGLGTIRDAGAAIRSARPRFAVIVARGTSDHAGTYARYVIETRLGIPAALAAPSVVTIYGAGLAWADVLLLAISQSGRSPDLVAITEAARNGGALTVSVTNDPGAPLADAADLVVPCHAGAEHSVAATKTYAAELAAVAAVLGDAAGDATILDALPMLPDAAADAVSAGQAWLQGAGSPVDPLAAAETALVVGRGFNYATALEIALKLKEAALLFADGYSTADLLHGPIAVAHGDTHTLAFRAQGPAGPAVDEVVERLIEAGSPTWVVGRPPEISQAPVSTCLVGTGVPEVLSPVPLAIPGQLLAEAVARARGLDPDTPPGLAKVTRTV